jgi:predicted aspartyl protease
MDSSQQDPVAVISNQDMMAEIFVRTEVCGRNVTAILDTGCETIYHRHSMPIKTTSLKLYAANGTEIPLLGSVETLITIEGYDMTVRIVASEVLDELILAVDWLTKEGCAWDFRKAVLKIRAWQIIFQCATVWHVRRFNVLL